MNESHKAREQGRVVDVNCERQAPIRQLGADLTIRWSCRAGEFVLWVSTDSFLTCDQESAWKIRDFWPTHDGDFVTITNRWSDLPSWFELLPSEVGGNAAFKMMERLQAGHQPKKPMHAANIWRVKAGDRLVWVSLERPSEPVREILVCKACALASGESSTLGFDSPIHFAVPDEKDLSPSVAAAMRAGFKAAVGLGVPRDFAEEWRFGV
jgi:hypothetical protein